MRMKRIKYALIPILAAFLLTLFSCAKDPAEDIVKGYDSFEALSAVFSHEIPDISFDGFKKEYSTVYGITAQETFTDKNGNTAVFRAVSDEYEGVSNLSGYTDTRLFDYVECENGSVVEIETRDGVYAAAWHGDYNGKKFNFSLTCKTDDGENYKKMLKKTLEVCPCDD